VSGWSKDAPNLEDSILKTKPESRAMSKNNHAKLEKRGSGSKVHCRDSRQLQVTGMVLFMGMYVCMQTELAAGFGEQCSSQHIAVMVEPGGIQFTTQLSDPQQYSRGAASVKLSVRKRMKPRRPQPAAASNFAVMM